MFEAYKVAVKISLINEVSGGLIAMAGQMSLLNKNVIQSQAHLTSLEGKLKDIKRLGMIGVGISAVGFGGLSLLKGPYEEAKKLAQAKANFETLNLSTADNQSVYAKAASQSQKILGTNITENVKALHDLHTAFGDLHHAISSSDAFAKYSFAAKIANGGKDVAGLVNNSVKALEHRGGKVINDSTRFEEELGMQSKVYFGTKGKVSGTDFFAASQTGKMAYALFDKEYLYGQFSAFMQAKSGATAGTASMTGFSSLIGGHMDNKAKGFLAQLGLLQVGVSKTQVSLITQAVDKLQLSEKEKNKLKKAEMPLTGGLIEKHLELFAHRPDQFINNVLVPAIRKRFGMNLSDESVALLVTQNFNRGTSDDLGQHILNRVKFEKDAAIFQNSMAYTSAYQHYLKSPQGAEEASAEAWKNLSTVIGTIYLPKITSGLLSLAEGLTNVSKAMTEYPRLTKALTYGFIGLSGAMAFGGGLILLKTGFQGVGLAISGLNALKMASTATALTNVGGGLTAISGATKLATLGGTLGIIAGGLCLLGAATGGMAWILDKLDSDTDEQAHPGMRRKHMRGRKDIWEVDPTLDQSHAGMHFQRAGRGGTWVLDAIPPTQQKPVTTVGAPPASKMVQVSTNIHLDGKKIAENTSKYQAKEMGRPPSGPMNFDGTMALRPVGAGF